MAGSKRGDILVVGGGPAGSAAAITLLNQGHNVALFEKRGINREKVCGDGLAPDAQFALKELDVFDVVEEQALRVPDMSLFGYRLNEISIDCVIYTIERTKLDQHLRNKVESLGGSVFYDSLTTMAETSSDRVLISDNKNMIYKGDCLVLATGARVDLAKQLGFDFGRHNAVAIRAYALNNIGLDSYMVWFNEKLAPGYGWVFPLPENKLNLGVGYFENYKPRESPKKLINIFLEDLKTRYGKDIELISKFKGGMLRTGLRKENLSKERVLLVGENIHATYNLIGEGIGKALQSGIIAAETIANLNGDYSAAKLKAYDKRIVDEFSAFHVGYDMAAKLLNKRLFNFLFTKIFAYSEKARSKMNEVLEEKVKPTEVLSIPGLLKTIFF